MGLARGLVRAWYGESLPRRVVRPNRSKRARPLRRALAAVWRREWRWPELRRVVPAWLKNPRARRTRAAEQHDGPEIPLPEHEPVEQEAEPFDLTAADGGEADVEQEPGGSSGANEHWA